MNETLKHKQQAIKDIQDGKSLPVLPILRDDFISQDTVDKVAEYLVQNEKHHPRIIKCIEDDMGPWENDIHEFAYPELSSSIKCLQDDEGYDIPKRFVVMLDLVFELRRRIRKMIALPEPEIHGVPFGGGPDGYFPDKLPYLTVRQEKYLNIMSEQEVNKIANDLYQQNKEIFYDYGEALRRYTFTHNVRSHLSISLNELLDTKHRFSEEEWKKKREYVNFPKHLIFRCIGIQCEIPFYTDYREIF